MSAGARREVEEGRGEQRSSLTRHFFRRDLHPEVAAGNLPGRGDGRGTRVCQHDASGARTGRPGGARRSGVAPARKESRRDGQPAGARAMTPSAASRISSKLIRPSWFSIFAMSLMSFPASPRTSRMTLMSVPLRTNDAAAGSGAVAGRTKAPRPRSEEDHLLKHWKASANAPGGPRARALTNEVDLIRDPLQTRTTCRLSVMGECRRTRRGPSSATENTPS